MGKRVKCRVEEVKMKDPNRLPPTIVTFQHGTLEREAAGDLKCSVSRCQATGERVFTVSAPHSNVKYTGREVPVENQLCRTMIAIRNRKTNKMRLYETESVLLSPVVGQETPTEAIEIEPENRYATLQKSFGSKSSRRRTEQEERSRTDTNVLNAQLMRAISGVKLDVTPVVDTTSSWIPHCNRSAKAVQDVYNLHDLLTREELDSMENKAKQVKANATTLKKEDYSVFFHENLPKVLARDKDQLTCLEALLYLDCVIRFFSAPYKAHLLKNICPFSQLITAKITQEFTEQSTTNRLRPPKMKDKAAIHVIIISLLIFNYKFDLNTILKSTKESIKRLTVFSRAIGATKYGKDGTIIELKLPLAVPYEPMGSKKGVKRGKRTIK